MVNCQFRMPTRSELVLEAKQLRCLLEENDRDDLPFTLSCFPVMSCKLTSLLLAYRLLKVWPEIEVYGVGGVARHKSSVTHYWVEVGEYVLDITGDQYNTLHCKDLGAPIVKHRPYPKVHVERKECSYLIGLFYEKYRDRYINTLDDLAQDTLMNIDYSYRELYFVS